ncbi:nucleotidyltransferase domain-containing protein [Zunongwangia sp. F260]|uniref:Nucleotidyltransferase domain-containing protein n=1 Tax=Autumnicola lenta TaxID=3075593 RepID=A0ABU3CM52_9FLAO|nr:nucleotidyltransferase domain-containing protein [Zunongwangia sp. F260]MDT0647424.1 nucleotidyltransferase domain-containing protein [Zunongwangia sp. F260]
MRLKSSEIEEIKQVAKECFGTGAKVYLFGSRTDNTKKGGDIDLYIETTAKENLFDKKIKMLRMLYERLGEQKIDIVVNNHTKPLYIHKVAREEGIIL